jgi:stearoyl-CoA desaturase (delta-9 desaturase)
MATATGIPSGKVEKSQQYGEADGWLTRTSKLSRVLFWVIHASSLLVFVVGAPTEALILCAVTYSMRVVGITGVYHRYFAHKTYKTSRIFQFILAYIGTASTQKGPLWWAATHRRHHRYSDMPGDVHSPKDGLWYSHVGWIFDGRWGGTTLDEIPDFAKYPEIRWLNQFHWIPPLSLALACYWIGGFAGLVWGFSVSTTLLWHSTFSVNSLCHVWGSRRYDTTDTSRNNWFVALITFGEGWHNNHHHYMSSARQGFRWWEYDVTYYILRLFAALGLVWDLREPSEGTKERNLIKARESEAA